ncbi:MAG: homocysteine S-methyltransferase family protein [Chloroflexi bacterium]|nr:homocysteine S-methyltransferase family protein [Chloroflexota bacterium]
MAGLLERLQKDVVLGAEGYLFELERRGYLKAGAYVPEVVIEHPNAVAELHREFLRAGAEVMVAFTYYGHRAKMRAIGREGDLERLNRDAVRLAKSVANEGGALVAGNVCNTWEYDPQKPEESEQVVRPMFEEQVQWACEEGADFFIAETFNHLGEALIALDVIKQTGLPAMVTFAAKNETSYDDQPWEDACKILEDHGADVVGLNCSRGPDLMLELIERIRPKVSCYVAAQPVPYHTTHEQPYFQVLTDPHGNRAFPVALDPFLHTRFEMADFARRARDIGVNYIGICCGGAPHHVRAMAEALGRTVPASAYSPDLSLHPVLGAKAETKAKVQRHLQDFDLKQQS